VESNDISKFVGVHIRQGDKMKGIKTQALRKKVESQYDSAIIEIIRRTDTKIYLSCDDPNTWGKYRRLYGKRIESSPKTRTPLRRDAESIAEAVLDLYLLSKTEWMLYGVGTFGYAAHLLGGNMARNILHPKDEFFLFFQALQSLPLESYPSTSFIIDEITRNARY
jgi:hypothetical protein